MKSILAIVSMVILACLVSFLATAGVFYLICLCFSLKFSWAYAIGVWLILWLLSGVVKVRSKKD